MTARNGTWLGLVAAAALAAAGCSGFGTDCSTDSDCTAKNPAAFCDPTLQVCFIRPGPVVTNIQPADQATGVTAVGATVTATFSEAINDAGVKDTSFIVDGQGFETFGDFTASANAKQETFVPFAAGLAVGTEYTVKLTADIKDMQGRALIPFQSTFKTADGAWQSDTPYTGTQDVGLFSVAANYYGEIVSAADLEIGTSSNFELWAGVSSGVLANGNYPDFGTTPVYSVSTDDAFSPHVSLSTSGRAFVAFSVSSAGNVYAKASTYDPGTTSWAPYVDLPVPVSSTTFYATVVALPAGNAVAAWTESVGGKYKVKGRSYGAAVGWAPSTFFIQSDANADCQELKLAADLGFDVLAAWTQYGGAHSQIEVSYYPGTGSFSSPIPISDVTLDSDSPDIALGYYGPSGYAKGAAVWRANSGGNYHIFGSQFDPGASPAFGPIKQLDSAPTSAFSPHVGAAANGDAVAIWIESAGSGGSVVTSRFEKSNESWRSPETLVTDTANLPSGAVLTVDPGGNVLAVWLQMSGTAVQAYGRRFTVTGGWTPPLGTPPTRLTTGTDSASGFDPGVAVDALGLGSVFVSRTDTSVTPNIRYLDYIPFY